MGFPTFGLSQEVDPASLEHFKQAEAERKARIGQSFDFRGPALTDPDYGSKIQQFGTYNRYLEDAEKQRQMAISTQQAEEEAAQIGLQQEYARKAKEEADRDSKRKRNKRSKNF
jgi:D-alanyl-D-alanine dipeptidase